MLTERRQVFGQSHWRDFADVSKAELEALAQEYNLPLELMQDCLDPEHLPKLQRTGNMTFLMLRAYDEKAPAGASDVQACTRKLAIFWGENFLLTVHRAPLVWVDEVWDRWEKSSKRTPSQIVSLVHDLVEECLYTYEAPIDNAALTMDKLEDAIFHDSAASATSSHILETSYLAKKRATLFKRMLRLTRDLLPSVSRLGDPGSNVIQSLKEEADRLYFYSDDLVETANDLVQLSISLTTNRTNEVVRILTLVSIFLLPLNLVVGIYGMNFEFMPELHWRFGYPLVILLMIGIEVGIYLLLKKRGWIKG